MWPESTRGEAEVRRSQIACYTCRKYAVALESARSLSCGQKANPFFVDIRRKVRCDREFPQCLVCEQTDQVCEYPSKLKKPGPKIGTSQRPKRRRRGRQRTELQRSRSPCSPYASQDNSERSCVYLRTEDRPSPTDPGTDEYTARRRNSELNINDLSFILHPCHEASTPEKEAKDRSPGKENREQVDRPLLQQASEALGMSQDMVQEMIYVYFRNMVAINLFHEPSFTDKLTAITSLPQTCALLAAMLGYAARFYPSEMLLERAQQPPLHNSCPPPEHFMGMALKLIDQALIECDDEPPPICVVQALIIATHCQLTRGVHGKAWRSLGMCVRLAYELNFHLIDTRGVVRAGAGDSDTIGWRDDEEKRRAWWAIWEMDVFASTIKRTPTAIDWAHMETLLPIDDADWFSDRPAPSAFMERDPIRRWKSVQDTGNQSPKAWFLVINSLMKDAQIISSPRGVPLVPDANQRRPSAPFRSKSGRICPESGEVARQHLEILANAVQCFVLALPPHLRYRNQNLSFDPPVPGQTSSLRQLHCGIYNIFVMTQLTRLMIYRYDLFRQPTTTPRRASSQGDRIRAAQSFSSGIPDLESASVRQYFEAADNILSIVNRSCEEHIQHINPFLLSTIWLASAVQLVRKYLDRSVTNTSLIKSRFDVLYLTYKRCVSFWDAKTALQQNLETLEVQLESHFQTETGDLCQASRAMSKQSADSSKSPYPSWIPDESSSQRNGMDPEVTATIDGENTGLHRQTNDHLVSIPQDHTATRAAPGSSALRNDSSASGSAGQGIGATEVAAHQEHHQQQDRRLSQQSQPEQNFPNTTLPPSPPQSSANPAEDAVDPNQSFCDIMQMSLSFFSPSLFDPMALDDPMQNNSQRQHLDLPVDIQNLLSGLSTY
ncbi:Uncharacterized protein TPAR_01620 [Tolypocladium paradoxum]|uniref:Xylanolytic transcriptional activator regulatory domain-containing protein n=1 Tax=Tolypocladium paradoxum TaxID=94208 RepID=A0A2S4L6X4_9HYPO|nr:Uncharacterized protein TPAR_01620 [Tolypocladium paradoxum]